MQEFLDMGGYAAFIWPCFIVSAGLLVGLLVVSRDTSAYGVDTKYVMGFHEGRPIKTRMLD